MAIHSIVLEKPLGSAAEGDVIQVEEEVATALISAGVAREATSEDLNGGDDEEAEAETASEDTPEVVQDQVRRLAASAEDTIQKAVEKVSERISKRHIAVPQNRHVAGSDELGTGGFKSLGETFLTWKQAKDGDYTSARRYEKFMALARTKGQASISGGSGLQGGSLVPTEFAKEVWKLAFDKVPDLLGMCSQVPMENQTLKLPIWSQPSGTTGITAEVTAEGEVITDTVPVTATVQLDLQKFAALINVTDELERFNSYAFDSVLKSTVPQRIRYLMNDSIVNGSNGQVNLVGNAAAVVIPRAVANRISYMDVLKMEAALWDDFDDAVWFVNQGTTPELYSIGYPNTTATTQFPAFTPGGFGNLLGPKPVGQLLGRNVYKLENVPTLGSKGDLILASFSAIAAGSTGLIADGTPFLYFDKAISTYRFIWYADTTNRLNAPYSRKGGSYASNIVVLSNLTS